MTIIEFQASLKLDLTHLHGKVFKVVAELIRSAIKNEHGYKATEGISDSRLQTWPIVIRFTNKKCRERFEKVINEVMNPDIIAKIGITHLKPGIAVTRPVRMMMG